MDDLIIKAIAHLDVRVSNLNEDVSEIKQQVQALTKRPDMLLKEEWMDGQDVKLALNISKRTLQTLRDSGKLIPTRMLGKYYYRVEDIKQLLSDHYIRYHQKNNEHHD